jgi:hypothetical protein
MVTAIAGVLARRGALFTMPPKGLAMAAAAGQGGGDGEGGGPDAAASPEPRADERQAAVLFAAAGRR